MKMYNPKSTVRTPMNYGGMANMTGNAMSAGMRKDKAKKQNMMTMGMMYGGKPSKRSR
tara:strand:+ start:136 stop:309 length:174 start_codon:yes stop_codon:yes gene_type:complete